MENLTRIALSTRKKSMILHLGLIKNYNNRSYILSLPCLARENDISLAFLSFPLYFNKGHQDAHAFVSLRVRKYQICPSVVHISLYVQLLFYCLLIVSRVVIEKNPRNLKLYNFMNY